MDIEFIKWLCEKAEGFILKYGINHGDLLWFEDVNCGINTTVYRKVFYPHT